MCEARTTTPRWTLVIHFLVDIKHRMILVTFDITDIFYLEYEYAGFKLNLNEILPSRTPIPLTSLIRFRSRLRIKNIQSKRERKGTSSMYCCSSIRYIKLTEKFFSEYEFPSKLQTLKRSREIMIFKRKKKKEIKRRNFNFSRWNETDFFLKF